MCDLSVSVCVSVSVCLCTIVYMCTVLVCVKGGNTFACVYACVCAHVPARALRYF